MSSQLRLVLAFHNHQPVGNFDDVFAAAYRDSYKPFLDVLETYPQIPFVLHLSGSLLEWLVEHRCDYVDRVRNLVARGQVELLGGPYYEPILTGIPGRDRIGQITAYSNYLKQTFGVDVRGIWIPERVWEQSLVSDIARSGIEYTLVDDFHFHQAGLPDDRLHGFYVSEDEGKTLKIFPGSERLRYAIPFQDPIETIHFLQEIQTHSPNTVVTFGDDGEKFGTWPETKRHVYEHRWLKQFLDTLTQNANWLKLTTFSESLDHLSPQGRCYLPDCSYREMTDWALPTQRQRETKDIEGRQKENVDWPKIKRNLRGGFWRNFRMKYPEANEMYVRMMEVSNRLDNMQAKVDQTDAAAAWNSACNHLYKAQCNCGYWHGAFGGLYLPHLRNAIYRELILAENILEKIDYSESQWVRLETADFDCDSRNEIKLSGHRLAAYLSPYNGGQLYELDLREIAHNLLATLNRREELYHDVVRKHAPSGGSSQNDLASIHDRVSFKQPNLHKKLIYDHWPRKSLVDHFLQPGLSFEEFQKGHGEMSDFVRGPYEAEIQTSKESIAVRMSRTGKVGPYAIGLTKTMTLETQAPGSLAIRYDLKNIPTDIPFDFGVEFNFSGLPSGLTDRYFYDENGRQLGSLETVWNLAETRRIGLCDEWLGLDISLDASADASFWVFPLETVSASESGFELVHQSCMVMPHWKILSPKDGCWSVELTLSVDTSAAQAKRLKEHAISG